MREHDVVVSVALARSQLAALGARLCDERLSSWRDILGTLEQLLARFELLRMVLDSESDLVFAKDPAGHYVLINPGGAEFLGRTVEEIVGRDDSALFGRECAQRLCTHDRAVMNTGLSRCFEETLPVRGVPTRMLANESPWYEPRGRVCGLIGTARDVSGLPRTRVPDARTEAAEQQLRRSLAADLRDGLHQYAALAEIKLAALRRAANSAAAAELHEPLEQIERLVEHAERSLRPVPLQPSR